MLRNGLHSQIGALRDVRKDLWVRRGELLAAVIADLEWRLYTSAIGVDSDSSEEENDTPELSQTLVMDEVLDARRSAVLSSRSSKLNDGGRRSLLIGELFLPIGECVAICMHQNSSSGL